MTGVITSGTLPSEVRAAVCERPHEIRIRSFPMPQIGEDEGILQVESVGICGTDIEIFEGRLTAFPLPLIMGHEIVGKVAAAGSRALKRWGVNVGDRVVVESIVGCGFCGPCQTGNARFCKKSKGYGLRTSCDTPPYLWGALCEYMYLAPETVMHPVKESVPMERAMMVAAAIANGVQWVQYAGQCRPGDIVVVQGVGAQGICSAAAAQAAGAQMVIAVGLARDEKRFALARQFGATAIIVADQEDVIARVAELTGGQMADLVIDVSGSPAVPPVSLRLVRPQGRVVQASMIGNRTVPVETDLLSSREISWIGVRSKGYQATKAALTLAESGRYPFEEMISHRFPLERTADALNALMRTDADRPTKVAIMPGQ